MKNISLKKVIILCIGLFLTTNLLGQITFPAYQSFKITGTVRDAFTNEPIQASLIFQSLPNASDVYIIGSGTEEEGYEFVVRNETKYVIEIISENYKPEIDTVVINGNIEGLDFSLLSVKPGQILRLNNIYFSQGDYKIQEQSIQELSELVMLLNLYPGMKIRLEGHTDRLGGRSANIELSENRVLEIKKYLEQFGIHAKRIETAAFGGSKPLSTENSEESRKLNRRVEVRILSV